MSRCRISALLVLSILILQVSPALAQVEPRGDLVNLNGFEMYYETLGDGEPLLLVHGWSGNTEYFRPLLETLAENFTLIVPDLRGHGRSTNPAGRFTMGMAADDLEALLDHLGLGRVRALGASAGGLILLHMGVREPSRIEKMVLVGAGTRFLPHCRESMLATDAGAYPETWWELMRSRHSRGDPQIQEIVGYLRSFGENEGDVDFSASDLATIEAPTLIVHGDQDWCFPPSLAAEMYEAIPTANLWVIPGGEHVPILGEHAQRFLDTALAFFQDH